MVLIQLKDMCCYDEDFEYDPFLVDETEDKDFEKKFEQFTKLCNEYNDFQEVEDFIDDNFKRVEYETRLIKI